MKNKKMAVKLLSCAVVCTMLLAGCTSGSDSGTVWIPTNGGTKYHKDADCSDMINPQQVSLEYAEAHGFEPCKLCY